jgi:hypothetical protein
MSYAFRTRQGGVVLLACLAFLPLAHAKDKATSPVTPQGKFATLHIPRMPQRPTLADFSGMQPAPEIAKAMLKVDGFVQRDPKDGSPVSQKTEVYLGYTDKNLYVVCICFDSEPNKIRARMARRENINNDDQFGFVLDTFHDHMHGLFFYLNPMGVQQDGIWNDYQEPDYSYDMVWNSDAKLTGRGYVVWFEIPFKSLRFSQRPEQTWGIFFERDLKRNNEYAFYPHISSNKQGFLPQETEMDGLEKISPGRNMQFIPYVVGSSFRSLDDRDPNRPRFNGAHLKLRPGLDSKIVVKDSFVLDATINPDFSQVESDEPQVTVNQRFEVYFPEKRPFFLENSSYFDTPVTLLFTRRIADPEYGVRLTGKRGPWALGALLADDKSPGESVAPYDPLAGHKAYFGVLRVNHDIGKESTIGMIYTDRELHTVPGEAECTANACLVGSNRVGGVDAKIKFSSTWYATLQALESHTKFFDGTHKGGTSYNYWLEHSSRKVEYNAWYQDTAANFETDTGFFRRPDIRRFSQFSLYRFRPEGKILQWHGPGLFTINNWDHSGTRLDWFANTNYRFILQRQTTFGVFANLGHERLRPVDYSALGATNKDYAHEHRGFFFEFGYFKPVSLIGEVGWGTDTNYSPAFGPPVLGRSSYAQLSATFRPVRGLTIDNSYLLTRVRSLTTNANMFNNHIIRSKWNYQFTRALSLRVIGQYNAVLSNYDPVFPNRALSSLPPAKNFSGDVLLTYFVHPGTAFYLGYNSDLQNLNRSLGLDQSGNQLRTPAHFLNDGRQIFVKISYLFQY